MTREDIAERLDAVERRLDAAYPVATERDDEERIEAFADRLADLEATVEAIEGYVGEIERVDDDLERRADAALATVNDLEATTTELEATTADLEATTRTLTEGLAAVEATVDDLATASDARDPGGETGQGSWSHRQPIHAGSERGREHSGGADTRPSPRSNPDRGRDRPDEPASPDGGERAMGPDASGCCEAVTRGCHETDHGERGHDTGDAGVDTAVSGWGRDPGTDATDETPLADHQAGHPRGPGTGRGRAGQPDANWSDPGEERSLLARLRERL